MLCHLLLSWFGENRKAIYLPADFASLLYRIPNLQSATQSVAHSEELPLPERRESWNLDDDAHFDLGDREIDVDDMERDRICTTKF
jgi:hypothetical protein